MKTNQPSVNEIEILKVNKDLAEKIIDNHRDATPLMDFIIIQLLRSILSEDLERLSKLKEIIWNTVLHCEIILIPDPLEENKFPIEETNKARILLDQLKKNYQS